MADLNVRKCCYGLTSYNRSNSMRNVRLSEVCLEGSIIAAEKGKSCQKSSALMMQPRLFEAHAKQCQPHYERVYRDIDEGDSEKR